jgi:hypothetical protein
LGRGYFQHREREQHYDGFQTEQDMDVTGIGRDLMLHVLKSAVYHKLLSWVADTSNTINIRQSYNSWCI